MAHINKKLSERDASQTLQSSYNDVDASLTIAGFLTGKLGNKITLTVTTTTIAGDTQVVSYFDNGVLLYTLTLIYSDGTQNVLISAERTA